MTNTLSSVRVLSISEDHEQEDSFMNFVLNAYVKIPSKQRNLIKAWVEEDGVTEQMYEGVRSVMAKLEEPLVKLAIMNGKGLTAEQIAQKEQLPIQDVQNKLDKIKRRVLPHYDIFLNGADCYPFNIIRTIYQPSREDMQKYIRNYYDEKTDIRATFAYAISSIPVRETEILKMRYLEKKTYKEIADCYSVTHEWVRQVILKALSRIKQKFSQETLMAGMKKYHENRILEERVAAKGIAAITAIKELRKLVLAGDASEDAIKDIVAYSKDSFLNMTLEDFASHFNMSYRTLNALRRHLAMRQTELDQSFRITMRDITEMSDDDIRNIENIGAKSYNELIELLEAAGLSLKTRF